MKNELNFPLPGSPGHYGSYEEFENSRKEDGQWVFWEDRVELILEGRYNELKPLHVELSPTYLCNFSCPWCSCRSAREDWCGEDVFNHPHASENTIMSEEKIDSILINLAKHNISIQWVGGEPTMHPYLYTAVVKANKYGLKQCIYTNGSILDAKKIKAIMSNNVSFIRISLDAVTKEIHQIHHGYNKDFNYHSKVLENLKHLVEYKYKNDSKTQIGISVVIDERNLKDMVPVAKFLHQISQEYGKGIINFAIFRPTYQFYTSEVILSDSTSPKMINMLKHGSEIANILDDSGINLVVPSASLFTKDVMPNPDYGDKCLSCGLFGEITPKGDYVICSDRYGNPDYFIGNISEKSIDKLWSQGCRSDLLSSIEQKQCFKKLCPRNGRGYYYNNVFKAIEELRANNELELVKKWINDLRELLPKPEHSFFL